MPLREQSNLVVRTARLDEAAAIAAVLRQAFLAYEPLYTPAAFAATTPTVAQLQARWDEGPVWVALRPERLAGTVAAVPTASALYLRSMAVHPQSSGQGVGKTLLEHVESYARTQGFKRLYLSTTPFLAAAIRLYERGGFVRTKDGPLELCGTPLFTMEKIL